MEPTELSVLQDISAQLVTVSGQLGELISLGEHVSIATMAACVLLTFCAGGWLWQVAAYAARNKKFWGCVALGVGLTGSPVFALEGWDLGTHEESHTWIAPEDSGSAVTMGVYFVNDPSPDSGYYVSSSCTEIVAYWDPTFGTINGDEVVEDTMAVVAGLILQWSLDYGDGVGTYSSLLNGSTHVLDLDDLSTAQKAAMTKLYMSAEYLTCWETIHAYECSYFGGVWENLGFGEYDACEDGIPGGGGGGGGTDTDDDGIPDESDPDDDNDGVPDGDDPAPLDPEIPGPPPPDNDDDGIPDGDDPDDDNDGVPDGDDPCPLDPDCDDDGIPDGPDPCPEDPDCDDDGVPDDDDPSPEDPDCDDDGTPDGEDPTPCPCEGDEDCDGIPDDDDPDPDGDGECEGDEDCDGTPDEDDPDPDGDGLCCPLDHDCDRTPDAEDEDYDPEAGYCECEDEECEDCLAQAMERYNSLWLQAVSLLGPMGSLITGVDTPAGIDPLVLYIDPSPLGWWDGQVGSINITTGQLGGFAGFDGLETVNGILTVARLGIWNISAFMLIVYAGPHFVRLLKWRS